MATWIIGDVQGCYEGFMGVLEKAGFDFETDRLWSLGDLVNRGPQSLMVLRFCRSLGSRFLCTLGNHDLHLLAVGRRQHGLYQDDSFTDVLNAPDCDQLLEWLRHQPLLHYDAAHNIALCHAGIAPQWSLGEAQGYARELENVLRGQQADELFGQMYGDQPNCWIDDLKPPERWRLIINYFTRMRFCDAKGSLNLELQNRGDTLVHSWMPWFRVPDRPASSVTIVFGHWAALRGKTGMASIIALDTGYVWGGSMTLMNLETRERVVFEVPAYG